MNDVARSTCRAWLTGERSPWRALACLLWAATCASPWPASAAAVLPISSEAAPAKSPSFVLRAVRFNGNTVFSSDALGALVADKLGQEVTLADLQLLAARVTEHYRQHELVLTQVVVPAQDVGAGTVEFSVLEGRLGRVRIERIDDAPVPDSVVRAVVAGLQPGQLMTRMQLERAVLMLSDLPGLATQASLEAGDATGTFDLVLELKAAPRTNFSVDLDNQGSRATGRYRIGLAARVNSPFGRGDNLDVRLLNAFGKGLSFGRVSYELPLGGRGPRASIALGRVQYELGSDFAALGAYGSANVAELALTYPLLRSRAENLFGKAGVEVKDLMDHLGAVGQASSKRMRNLNAGFVYERRDGWLNGGYVSFGLTGYVGRLDIRSDAERLLDQDSYGRHTIGRFARASYQLSRLQTLGPKLSAYLALAGQWANRNLDSADKIAAGGPRAVRAFSGSTGIGDEAQIVNAELRWSATQDTSLALFYDLGRVRVNHSAAPGDDNRRMLGGGGLGLYWTVSGGAALRASVAWPKRDTGAFAAGAGNDESGARAYAQIVKTF